MQGKGSKARRLHSQQTEQVARVSQPIQVGRRANIDYNYNFSIAGSSVFDTQSCESGDNTLYEDSCETDSNDTIYNKSRSGDYIQC